MNLVSPGESDESGEPGDSGESGDSRFMKMLSRHKTYLHIKCF